MIKIITSIIALYVLYYAGNIVYDLFLKKDSSVALTEEEEYSLTEFSEKSKNEIQAVGIDDVERINTPDSFNVKELFAMNEEKPDESRNLAYWRKKFESEQDIDSFDSSLASSSSTDSAASSSDSYSHTRTSSDIIEGSTEKKQDEDQEQGQEQEHEEEIAALESEREEKTQDQDKNDHQSSKLELLNEQFKNFLTLAETNVQVVSDIRGFKVYHSMI